MSGIYGFTYRMADTDTVKNAADGLAYWNRLYGKEAHDCRVISNSAIGCHIEHFSDTFPHGRPILDYNGSPAVVDALLFNRDEITAMIGLPGDSAISDEELLLELIAQKGFAALAHVNGDFAGAIFDPASHQWSIFRDHLGVRPLYLYRDQNIFAFSTDQRGLLAIPGADATIDEEMIFAQLSGFDSLSLQRTDFAHVTCALPAAVTTVRAAGNGFELLEKPYWRPRQKKVRLGSDAAYQQELCRLITDAVNRRCDAIPGILGAELSGGLDSGVIDILINRHGRDARFYSWSQSPDVRPISSPIDERQVILDICKQEGIECHFKEMRDIQTSRRMQESILPSFVDTQNLSYGSAWLHSQGVRVVFTGHAGDEGVSHRASRYELFYNREYIAYFKLYWQDMQGKKFRFLRAIRTGLLDAWARYKSIHAPLEDADRLHSVFTDDFFRRMDAVYTKKERYFNYAPHKYIMQGGSRGRLDNAAYQGAFNGVRYLFPYADYRVMDYALSVPRRLYLTRNSTRVLFREAFRHIMPESLYQVDYKDAPSLRDLPRDEAAQESRISMTFDKLVCDLDHDRWSTVLDFDRIEQLKNAEVIRQYRPAKLYLLIHYLGRCHLIQKIQEKAAQWRTLE